MTTIRYRTIRFKVEFRGDVVRTQFKLPINLKVCTGFMVRIMNDLPVGETQSEIGTVSLEFNSKKELAVNDVVGYEVGAESKREFQQMYIELDKGSVVNCVYVDQYPTPMAFTPYTVCVYLRCSSLKTLPAACSI